MYRTYLAKFAIDLFYRSKCIKHKYCILVNNVLTQCADNGIWIVTKNNDNVKRRVPLCLSRGRYNNNEFKFNNEFNNKISINRKLWRIWFSLLYHTRCHTRIRAHDAARVSSTVVRYSNRKQNTTRERDRESRSASALDGLRIYNNI